MGGLCSVCFGKRENDSTDSLKNTELESLVPKAAEVKVKAPSPVKPRKSPAEPSKPVEIPVRCIIFIL